MPWNHPRVLRLVNLSQSKFNVAITVMEYFTFISKLFETWWFQYVRCSLLRLPRPFLLKGPDHQVQDLLAACQLILRLHSTWLGRGLLNYMVITTFKIVNLITYNWLTVSLPRFSSCFAKESRPKLPRHRWPPCGWHAAVLESHHRRLGTWRLMSSWGKPDMIWSSLLVSVRPSWNPDPAVWNLRIGDQVLVVMKLLKWLRGWLRYDWWLGADCYTRPRTDGLLPFKSLDIEGMTTAEMDMLKPRFMFQEGQIHG